MQEADTGLAATTSLTPRVEARVVSILKDMQGDENFAPRKAPNSVWTAHIKKEFRALGREFGCSVVPNEDESQWLFDLVWFQNDDQSFLRQVVLVLESEWSQSLWDIQYDFEKLLVAKAPYKVMIFQVRSDSAEPVWDYLKAAVCAFSASTSDEVYFLACFHEPTHRFEIKRFTFERGAVIECPLG